MSTPDSTWMSRVSRRKLLPRSSRDSLTLHRWVLVKNFVESTDSLALSQSHPPPSQPDDDDAQSEPPIPAAPPYECSAPSDESYVFPDWDIFVFPDASTVMAEAEASALAEAAWLDALLDELDDDDSEEEPAEPSATPVIDGLSAPASAFAASAPPALAAPLLPVVIPDSSLSSSSRSPGSNCNCTTPPPTPTSVPSTPRLLDDLPFFDHDGVDDCSDDESEGPETPLLLSAHAAVPSLVSVGVSEPAVVLSDPLSYFVYPTEPEPIFTTTPSSLPLQECS